MSHEILLFIVSAPSGAGKTSLCREVINLVPDLHFSISCTTRPARQHEKNGIDYYFLQEDEFMRMVEEDQLVEWTKIYGNYYGTAKATVEECRKKKKDVIFDIDHAGAQRLKKSYNNSITIFILPPSHTELEERLTQRGTDSEEVIKTRLNKAKHEIDQASWYQYQIVNDNFNEALTQLKEIITAERLKKTTMSPVSEKIILALDVETFEEAEHFVKTLRNTIGIFKVGKQLFTRCGPEIIEMVHDHQGKVFLDLKYHDIPNTVARAVEEAAKLKVFMLTIHAMGGMEMMKEAVASSISISRTIDAPPPLIVAVTILTSLKQEDLGAIGIDLPIVEAVSRLAVLAKQANVNGVVASAQEAQRIKAACGNDFIIVTPGIRPQDTSLDDQKRAVTPKEALKAGSSFMVIGRPILKANDPLKAAQEIAREVE